MTKRRDPVREMHEKRAEKYPQLRELDELAASFGTGEDRQMLAACEGPFSRLLRGDIAKRCIEDQLSVLKANPSYSVPDATADAFTVYRSDHVVLHVQMPGERRSAEEKFSSAEDLAGLAGHMIIGSIGPAPLLVDVFHHDDPLPLDVVDRAKMLTALGTVTLAPGMQLSAVAGFDVVDIPVPQPFATYMALDLPVLHPFRLIYERATLRPRCLTGVNQVDEQLIFVLRIAAAVGDTSSVPLVVSTLEDHETHHVRWEALQTLVSLDPVLAVDCLRNAQHDRHPELREVAKASLPRLEAALAAGVS